MRKTWIAACGLTALLWAGCARNGVYTVYEERYRLLFVSDQLSPGVLQRDPDSASRSYARMAALNRSFEDLTTEGFALVKVEPAGNGGGATKFVFRRTIPEGYRPTNAPIEFSGLYKYQEDENSAARYYIFDPRPNGYTVRVSQPDGEEVATAQWDGSQLRWRNGDVENSAILSGDGRSVIHTMSQFPKTHEDLETKTFEAFRVVSAKP
ncbi:hypothetical protein HY256_05205 [Candidatus Sumerlaeota bacterium]|nr:hypothetical protein [Candidatus Sumerlaeota bacterium]